MTFDFKPTTTHLLYFALSLSLVATSAAITFFALTLPKIFVSANTQQNSPPPTPIVLTPPPPSQEISNLLLLGFGGAGHSGGGLADTLLLVHTNTRTKTLGLISIPRDTWINLPVNRHQTLTRKLNAAYAIGNDNSFSDKDPRFTGPSGGGELSKVAAQIITGLPIHHFIATNFDGLEAIVNMLGGITVDLPHQVDDRFYPTRGKEQLTCGRSPQDIAALTATISGFTLEKNFPCRYEHLKFTPGIHQIDGQTTLKLARSRHGTVNGGDFARSRRQQAILLSFKDRLLSLGALDDLPPIWNQLINSVRTDLDLDTATAITRTLIDINSFQVVHINLSPDNVLTPGTSSAGAYILTPKAGLDNWTPTHDYISQQLNQAQ